MITLDEFNQWRMRYKMGYKIQFKNDGTAGWVNVREDSKLAQNRPYTSKPMPWAYRLKP